jgi:hypothetical protein
MPLMAQSDLLLIFMLRHRRPHVFRPPHTLVIADPDVDGAGTVVLDCVEVFATA